MNFQQLLSDLKNPGDRFKRSSENDNQAFVLLSNGQIHRVKCIPLDNLIMENGCCSERVKTEDEPFNPSLEYLKSDNFMYSPAGCECWQTIQKTAMIKFREHRGGLKESMGTLKEFKTSEDLIEYLKHHFSVSGVKSELYGEDHRTNWKETYIITVYPGPGVLGFTDRSISKP